MNNARIDFESEAHGVEERRADDAFLSSEQTMLSGSASWSSDGRRRCPGCGKLEGNRRSTLMTRPVGAAFERATPGAGEASSRGGVEAVNVHAGCTSRIRTGIVSIRRARPGGGGHERQGQPHRGYLRRNCRSGAARRGLKDDPRPGGRHGMRALTHWGSGRHELGSIRGGHW